LMCAGKRNEVQGWKEKEEGISLGHQEFEKLKGLY